METPSHRVFLTYLGYSMELPQGETVIGRGLSCQMRFNDPSVSRQHVRVLVENGAVEVEDLGSRNGTQVNGRPLSKSTEIHNGDTLQIGARSLAVHIINSGNLADISTLVWRELPIEPPTGPALPEESQQRCPECRAPVSVEDDLCRACGYTWADFRPGSVTQQFDLNAPAFSAARGGAKKTSVGTPTKALSAEAFRESTSPEDALAVTGKMPIRQETPESVRIERRKHTRHRVRVPVLYASDNLTVESMALNLSRSGVFVKTQILDQIGTSCTLTLMVDGAPALTFAGKVCRVVESGNSEPLGLGIEFIDLDAPARKWLDETLARLGTE